jgi:uncharacterized protein (DUF849 family)
MKTFDKSILTCAITGALHTPSMSPHLPVTPEEIAREAIAAARAGAAIIHLHARRPEQDERYGAPDYRPATYRAALAQIRRETDAIISITTGGGLGFTEEQRLAAPIDLSPEITSFNLGCVNFGLFTTLEHGPEFRYPWEKPFLAGTKDAAYVNTFGLMERIGAFGREHRARFEYDCFDVGHLYALNLIRDQGWLPEGPLFIQCVLGVPGNLGAEPEHLIHMRDTAERLFEGEFQMSALGAGRHQMRVVAIAASLGMHVRVGLDDSLGTERHVLSAGNAEQVLRARQILDALSIRLATPEEARWMLETKGADAVRF